MPWGRIDDKLHAHPKWMLIRDASPAWLFWSCLSWALGYSPSGFVPAHVAKGFGAQRAMAKLVEAGLWEEADGGYLIHDFTSYSSRQVDPELSAVRAEAGRLGGQARAAVRVPFPNVTEADKSRARGQVFRAVRSGKLTKGLCEVCGSADSRAHHRDYSKPLEVTWLCSRHHEDAHRSDQANDQAPDRANVEPNGQANETAPSPAHAYPRVGAPASPDPDPVPDPVVPPTPSRQPDPVVAVLAKSSDLRGEGVDLVRLAGSLRGEAAATGYSEARLVEVLPYALEELALSRTDKPLGKGASRFLLSVVRRVARPGVFEAELERRALPPERPGGPVVGPSVSKSMLALVAPPPKVAP